MEKKSSLTGPGLIVRVILDKLTDLPHSDLKVEDGKDEWLAKLSKCLNDLSDGMNDELGPAVQAISNELSDPDWDEAEALLGSTSDTVKKFSVAVQGLRDPRENADQDSEEWKTVRRIKNDKLKDLSAGVEGLIDRAKSPPQKEAFDVIAGLLKACSGDLGKVAEGLAKFCEVSLDPGRERQGLKRSSITRRSRDCAISRGKPTN